MKGKCQKTLKKQRQKRTRGGGGGGGRSYGEEVEAN